MDHLRRLRRDFQLLILSLIIIENGVLLGAWYLGSLNRHHVTVVMLVGAILLTVALASVLMAVISGYALAPIQALWQTILHLSPTQQGIPAPNLDQLKVGRDLVKSLATEIYQYTDMADKAANEAREKNSDISQNFIAQNLPLPLLLMDNTETIIFANEAAVQYVGIQAADMIGKNIYMVLDMSFPSEDTFDKWLKDVKFSKATGSSTWERVRLSVRDNHPARQFDLAAYYNRDNPNRIETMIALFDHTKQYSQDDQAISFIALSVHELRTPLTLLRGYIEVFEDEIDTSKNPELQNFMEKMRSQAEQLMAFVNNILNVARVDGDQLELRLAETAWPDVLKSAIQAISLRAKVRGITLNCRIAADLPPVGADRISIIEVINNLVDNAIKYSGESKQIVIDTHMTKEGFVETTVQDFGLGISTNIMSNLFTKFYRDHRNRAQIGGTGLGLYLSKAIVTAHGGSMWVRSKPGEGSTFGFTLVPYSQLTDDAKKSGETELVRGAHGWIKNHSLYRR